MKLLDYSFARPDPAKIKSSGYDGVLRYLSPNAGKNLTAPERDALRGAGLAIGLVWEWYASRAKEGRAAGVADAQAALTQANALGFPGNLPIYFAVDYDAPESDQAALNDYFDGVISVLGHDRTGVYAGYWIVKRLFEADKVKYGWQTYAWSGGNWYDKAQLRQTLNGQWGDSVDFDESTAADAGLWLADGSTATPTPAPAPPQTSDTHDYTIQKNDTFWGIEAANGYTHGVLQQLNPSAVPTGLRIGQVIKVPGAGAAPAAPAQSGYQIKPGDTFWGLESANGWAHGTLQGLNPGVVPTALKVGQTINVPGNVAQAPAQHTYGKHTIAKNETLWGIANANGWTVATLEQLNPGINPLTLQIGQTINTP